ncbi:MAG: phosphatase PAP2 family protein [Coriobacteriales bacterium]|jgi:membrane-associated phospholipid phosphatase
MEAGILLALQSARVAGVTQLMALISALGNAAFIWVVVAVIMLFFDEKRMCGILSLVSLALAFVLCELILGPIVGRAHPFEAGIGVTAYYGVSHAGCTFPSIHAASSFAAATVIAVMLGRHYGIPAVITAILIAFSRLYLGMNYPTDVLAGIVLGFLIAILVVWAFNTFFRSALLERIGTPKKNARRSVRDSRGFRR